MLQFDERVENIPFNPTQLSKGYPIIATSDDLLLSAANAADPPLPPDRQDLDDLRETFTAATAGDPNLIKLTVESKDPQEAANLANAWAGQVVTHLNDIYGGSGDMTLFEGQVANAKTTLEAADQALVAFRREYGMGFSDGRSSEGNEEDDMVLDLGIRRRLQAKTDLLTDYETKARQITQLLQEARAASAQVNETTSPAIMAGLLGDMLDLGLVNEETSRHSIQISLSGLDAEASLSALIIALEAKQTSIDEAITGLSAEVQTLQSQLADRQQELDQLLRDRQVAQDAYLTLSNKLQEATIETQDETGDVLLLSKAAVPKEPARPRRLLNTAVAGMLGLMVGVFGAFFIEYWQQETPEPTM